MFLQPIIAFILARLQERSTILGIIGALTTLGINISPAETTLIATIGAAIFSAILIFTKDRNIDEAIAAALASLQAKQVAAAKLNGSADLKN